MHTGFGVQGASAPPRSYAEAMPSKEPKAYDGKRITVTYDTGRCLHAAECVRGLPEAFDSGSVHGCSRTAPSRSGSPR